MISYEEKQTLKTGRAAQREARSQWRNIPDLAATAEHGILEIAAEEMVPSLTSLILIFTEYPLPSGETLSAYREHDFMRNLKSKS